MITCTVHERFDDAKDIGARAEAIRFVKEGFAWLALIVPVIWLLYHRLWVALVLYLAAVFSIAVTLDALGAPEAVGGLATVAMTFLLALEGNNLRRWTLARNGFQLVDVTSGRNMQECERRFFDDWLPAQGRRARTPAALPKTPAAPPRGPAGGDDVIGLFPEPGR